MVCYEIKSPLKCPIVSIRNRHDVQGVNSILLYSSADRKTYFCYKRGR